jgi:CubicO group peptidase (beta-lactamase class C family)
MAPMPPGVESTFLRRQHVSAARRAVFILAGAALVVLQGCTPLTQAMAQEEIEEQAAGHLSCVARQRCAARGFPAGVPAQAFATDGCTGWPDEVVLSCCIDHDMAYWCGGSRKARKQADAGLRACVKEKYGEWPGPVVGWMMQAAVTTAGSPHLPTYWRWGYGHEFGGGYCDDPGPDEQASAEPAGETLLVASALEARLPQLMKQADVQGFTMAVAKHGKTVWSFAHGLASAELERPATTGTIFEAASLGKVVLALITLRLADQGVIDLDEHLAESFAYPLLDHDTRYEDLTPRLLLQHASGLPNWGGWALDEDRDAVQFIGKPGDGFGYSGEGYVVLQRFVEFRTGRSLEELFVDLAAEAGMTSSSFISHAAATENYAQAWKEDGTERSIILFNRPIASFSLVSTAEDLAHFTAFYFQGGGLSELAYQESLRAFNPVASDAWGVHIPDGASIAWTLSWARLETGEDRVYFHAGNNGEFRSFMAYSPKHDIAVALMSNGTGGLSFLSEVLGPLIGNIKPAAVWWGYEEASPAE